MSYNRNYKNDYNRGYDQGYSRGYSSGSGHGENPTVDISGGCQRNGMDGASSGYALNWGDRGHPDNVSHGQVYGRQTNNRADLSAAEHAIQTARSRGYDQVTVRTNSDYVIKGHTEWLGNWQENGFKKANGGEVKNQDLFKSLDNASKGIQVNYEKIGNRGGQKK